VNRIYLHVETVLMLFGWKRLDGNLKVPSVVQWSCFVYWRVSFINSDEKTINIC